VRLIWSGRGVVLGPAFKRAVARKLERLARPLPGITDARVTCTAEKFRRTVRLILRSRRRTFTGRASAADMLAAVDGAIEVVRRQARDAKDRGELRRARRRRRAVAAVVPVA
jgi:ribosomal subunit interface protein